MNAALIVKFQLLLVLHLLLKFQFTVGKCVKIVNGPYLTSQRSTIKLQEKKSLPGSTSRLDVTSESTDLSSSRIIEISRENDSGNLSIIYCLNYNVQKL